MGNAESTDDTKTADDANHIDYTQESKHYALSHPHIVMINTCLDHKDVIFSSVSIDIHNLTQLWTEQYQYDKTTIHVLQPVNTSELLHQLTTLRNTIYTTNAPECDGLIIMYSGYGISHGLNHHILCNDKQTISIPEILHSFSWLNAPKILYTNLLLQKHVQTSDPQSNTEGNSFVHVSTSNEYKSWCKQPKNGSNFMHTLYQCFMHDHEKHKINGISLHESSLKINDLMKRHYPQTTQYTVDRLPCNVFIQPNDDKTGKDAILSRAQLVYFRLYAMKELEQFQHENDTVEAGSKSLMIDRDDAFNQLLAQKLALQQERVELRSQIASLKQQQEDTKLVLKEMNTEKRTIERKSQQKSAVLSKVVNKRRELQDKVKQQELKITELMAKTEDFDKCKQRETQYQMKTQQLIMTNDQLRGVVDGLRDNVQAQTVTISIQKEQMQELRERVDEIQSKCLQQKQEKKAMEAKYAARMRALQERVDEYEAEAMQNEMNGMFSSGQDAHILKLNRYIEELEAEKTKMKNQIVGLESEIDGLRVVQKQCQEQELHINELTAVNLELSQQRDLERNKPEEERKEAENDGDSNTALLCKEKFKQWLCGTVGLKRYLRNFEERECADIRLVEFLALDTLQNDIGIDSGLHCKLILKQAVEFQHLQQQFTTMVEESEHLRPYLPSFRANGILTAQDLHTDVQSKTQFGQMLRILDEVKLDLAWGAAVHAGNDDAVIAKANINEGQETEYY